MIASVGYKMNGNYDHAPLMGVEKFTERSPGDEVPPWKVLPSISAP
jgi:hypothetical protein